MINIKGKFEPDDLEATQDLALYPGQNATWVIVATGILLISPIVWLIIFPQSNLMLFPIIYVILLMISFYLLARFVWNPLLRKPNVQNSNKSVGEFEMNFDEATFNSADIHNTNHIPWKDFVKWKMDNKFLLLYRTDNMFYRIPLRYFKNESEVEFVIDQLRRNNVKQIILVKNATKNIFRVITLVYLVLAIGVMIYVNLK